VIVKRRIISRGDSLVWPLIGLQVYVPLATAQPSMHTVTAISYSVIAVPESEGWDNGQQQVSFESVLTWNGGTSFAAMKTGGQCLSLQRMLGLDRESQLLWLSGGSYRQ